jgi:hypothetical protein
MVVMNHKIYMLALVLFSRYFLYIGTTLLSGYSVKDVSLF